LTGADGQPTTVTIVWPEEEQASPAVDAYDDEKPVRAVGNGLEE